MRILFANFTISPFGAPDACWFGAAKLALARGYKVGISVWDWGPALYPHYTDFEQGGSRLFLRPRRDPPTSLIGRQVAKLRHKLFHDDQAVWRSTMSKFKPDVVLLNEPGFPFCVSVPGVYEYFINSPVPRVLMTHFNAEGGALAEPVFARARAFYGQAPVCVFVSRRNLDVARRQVCLPLDHAVVVDNPPGFDDWSAVDSPSTPPYRMALVARLECAVKGQDVVLNALARPEWRDRDWSLTLAGTGPDARYLGELVGQYGLRDKVRLAGQFPDIRALWAEHHLLVLGSAGEGKPLALTEAMMCGRPAVVTDVGGNAELIEDGVTGFVAPAATVPLIAQTLERAWARREDWRDMGIQARLAITKRLQSRPAEVLLDIIERTAKHRPAITATS